MNTGKRFEENFKKSIPEDVYYLRLHDSSVGFDIESSTQRFALKSPFDCVLYYKGKMYCLELKSTKEKSISHTGASPMIKEHQVKSLKVCDKYGIIAGFILNFRDTGNTYFVKITDFEDIVIHSKKKSINEKDIENSSILLKGRKLKVNYRYDLSELLKVGE